MLGRSVFFLAGRIFMRIVMLGRYIFLAGRIFMLGRSIFFLAGRIFMLGRSIFFLQAVLFASKKACPF
jgi:hypothetical protein